MVVNDLTFVELQRTIIRPWRAEHAFTISGRIVRKAEEVKEVRIVHTVEPQRVHAERYDAEMRSRRVNVIGFNRRLLPFSNGEDMTFPLLFEGVSDREHSFDILLVERVCRRLPQAVRILTNRQRKGKASFEISDEYDVQDVLHGILRAYLKYSVQEDPIPKSAGTRSARADISIQDLGVLIEVKYARGPDDQRRIFEEFSQDLVLYTQWSHLRTLFLIIYNSACLRDAEALERFSGPKEVNGCRFEVKVILA